MLVEIPDPDVIFAMIVAFLVGLGGLYGYYKAKPHIGIKKAGADPDYLGRLEYYERQLIDMKIRLDALEFEDLAIKPPKGGVQDGQIRQAPEAAEEPPKDMEKKPQKAQRMPNMASNDVMDYVLRLVTDKAMTSRDIQVTLGRSREHTSRLMKRLFEGGYVHRNVGTKPYTYSITERGGEKIAAAKNQIIVTQP